MSNVTLQKHLSSSMCSADTSFATFQCPACSAKFTYRSNLNRHIRGTHPSFREAHRAAPRGRRGELDLCFACGICSAHFSSRKDVLQHRSQVHQNLHTDFLPHKEALHGQTKVYRLFFDGDSQEDVLDVALVRSSVECVRLAERVMSSPDAQHFKSFLAMHVEMYKVGERGQLTTLETFAFRSETMQFRPFVDLRAEIHMALGDIERGVEEFLFRGSGWRILQPLMLDMHFFACMPLAGGGGGVGGEGDGCGSMHVAYYAKYRGVCVDAQSVKLSGEKERGLCFYYSVAAALCGDRNLEVLRDFVNTWGTPAGPNVAVCDIGCVEDAWKVLNIAINVVYLDEDRKVIPIRASRNLTASKEIVLLLFHTAKPDLQHYAWVKEPENLMARRVTDVNGRARTYKRFICWNCSNALSAKVHLQNHQAFCLQNHCQIVEMPDEGSVVSFDSGDEDTVAARRRMFKSGLMLFYDFECLQVPKKEGEQCACSAETIRRTETMRKLAREWEDMSRDELEDVCVDLVMEEEEEERRELEQDWLERASRLSTIEPAERKGWKKELAELKAARRKEAVEVRRREREEKRICRHKTKVLFDHVPFAYSMLLVDREGEVHFERTYVNEDAAEDFVETVMNLEEQFLPSLLSPGRPMDEMPAGEKLLMYNTTICYLCKEWMAAGVRCIDHDHLTGRVLGVAHKSCNLARREELTITAFCHNWSGYDSHLLVETMNKCSRVSNVNAIPLNTERFKCFKVNHRLQFLDSYAFLPDSLAKLVENLSASRECDFSLLSRMTAGRGQMELLLRKGVYPFAYVQSMKAVEEAKALPPRSAFVNDLAGGEQVSEEDYAHAQRVWSSFGCKDLVDYTGLYVRSDTLQLAEAVVSLRNSVWEEFELDLCQYLSLPHLAKDIMLKTTRAEMELISDQEMSDLVQKSIRGGLSFVNTRRVDASAEEPLSMTYVDENALYSAAMAMPLPLRDFRWMTADELEAYDPLADASDQNGDGYFLEVDLEYPEDLHEAHNSYPLAPHELTITEEQLSPYAKECLKGVYGKRKHNATKLTATFLPRERYLVHALNLKLYLELGMKLKKIHRGIKFYQEDFIRPYIDMCTNKRKTAPTESLRNMYKVSFKSKVLLARVRVSAKSSPWFSFSFFNFFCFFFTTLLTFLLDFIRPLNLPFSLFFSSCSKTAFMGS